MKLFVDTWGWLVLADSKDQQHQAAVQCYEEQSKTAGSVVTTNFVLDETFTLLFRRRPFDEAWRFADILLQSPFIIVEEITPSRFRKGLDLRRKFSDKPRISFTDLTSMVVMNDLKLAGILTEDAHFKHVGMGFRTLPDS
jgi:uncharacterized protein